VNLLVTAGATREFLDEIRFLSNLSSGKMGYAIALAAAQAGHAVTLVSGPTDLALPPGVTGVDVESAQEMLDALKKRWDKADALVMAAAVADYRPALRMPGKMKKTGTDELTLQLVRTPDILSELAQKKERRVLIGFALETYGLLAEATRKLSAKSLDAVVANSLENLGSDHGTVTVIEASGRSETWTNLPKTDLGRRLVTLCERLARENTQARA
jgi:phosphopantothenoylcysteine decarboxylase/phosphopantothenate--cysteine ligase